MSKLPDVFHLLGFIEEQNHAALQVGSQHSIGFAAPRIWKNYYCRDQNLCEMLTVTVNDEWCPPERSSQVAIRPKLPALLQVTGIEELVLVVREPALEMG